jgi:hypothetical protein
MLREDVRDCEHGSCANITNMPCRECEAEAMEEYERGMHEYGIQLPFLRKRLCPVDMTELTFRGVIAAPGYGHSYNCRCNHYWLNAGGEWYSEKDLRQYVPELTLADVR